jgi:dimethylhistidine N-methyltransferase
MQRSAAPGTLRRVPDRFAADVRYYLSLTPRQLPSRYLYDDLGSALFEAICRLPWYGITRAEQGLLRTHGESILARVHPLSTIVELGPGSGEKLAALLASRPRTGLTVHLVDMSAAALDAARRALPEDHELTVVTHESIYEAGLAEAMRTPRAAGKLLALFLGSNIGNFDPPGSDEFLRRIRGALAPGDCLLLGTDLVKPESELLLAYDDPLGVTAAFNRNLLVRVNRDLGADFDVGAFVHRAIWNAEASRVEMHLVSARDQDVSVPAAGVQIGFRAGEAIWTESSYKYRIQDVVTILQRAGFTPLEQWTEGSFALTLAEVR